MREVRLEFPHRTETLYTWGEVEPYGVALAMKPKGYLTHYSAMALHDLTDQIPRMVYLNVEQTPKPRQEQVLEQRAIDLGFRGKPRVSSNVAQYGDYRICLLSGMHTGGLAMSSMTSPNGQLLRVASLERTLIDIAVRPFYAGGVFEVLEAYKRALGRVDVKQVGRVYRELDYVYPYHQAIGFYMERAGYSDHEIESMGQFQMKNDFYLTHQMKNPQYSSRWRLYFPKGF
jgi:predicted transcriptional regulator of viral defense system